MVERIQRTKRITRVSMVIVWKLPKMATIIAERNISQTPGRERIVKIRPPNARMPAITKKIVVNTVLSILLLSEKG